MKYVEAKECVVIPLGRQGENNVETVSFPVKGWKELFGEGAFELLHRRCKDAAPYPCSITVDDENEIVNWVISGADTKYAGRGCAELVYIVNTSEQTEPENLLPKFASFPTTTPFDVTISWNANKTQATIVGTPRWSGYIAILWESDIDPETGLPEQDIPDAMEFGTEYTIHYRTTDDSVKLRVTNGETTTLYTGDATVSVSEGHSFGLGIEFTGTDPINATIRIDMVNAEDEQHSQPKHGAAIAKSVIYATSVLKALDGGECAPEPWQNWVDQVLTAGAAAEQSELDAEAWAIGKRGGMDVPITDETFHNNSKFYSEVAKQQALDAGFMAFYIDRNGDLIYERTSNVDVTFALVDGDLYVEVA